MLIVCKSGLEEAEFLGLKAKLQAFPGDVRWARRGGRLVLHLENATLTEQELVPIQEDTAVDYVLRTPSAREITRLFSRRDLLNFSLASTGALAALALGGPLFYYVKEPPGGRSPRGEVPIGKASSIPPNGARSRVVDGEEFLVIRRGEDAYHALSATCTHSRICLVEWDGDRQQVVCPCHRGLFDVQGNVLAGPPPRPLAYREVVNRDGTLYMRRSPQ